MRTVTIANREGSARRLGLAGLLALAGVGLASPALAADVPGGSGTKAVLQTGSAGVRGSFEKRADSDWYRVTLKGGQNYAFRAPFFLEALCARLNLRDLNGQLLRSILGGGGNSHSFEFRSNTTKTFFVEFKDCSRSGTSYPLQYSGGVQADARGDTTTAATIAVGQTINGLLNSSDDRDYFRTRLERGKRYTIRVDGDQPSLKLVDASNKTLRQDSAGNPAVLTEVTVSATGTYYLVVDDFSDTGNSYTLSLKTP